MKKKIISISTILIVIITGCISGKGNIQKNPQINLESTATVNAPSVSNSPTIRNPVYVKQISSNGDFHFFDWILNNDIIFQPSTEHSNKWYKYSLDENALSLTDDLPYPYTINDYINITNGNKYQVGEISISPSTNYLSFLKNIPPDRIEPTALPPGDNSHSEWSIYLRKTTQIKSIDPQIDVSCGYMMQPFFWSANEELLLVRCEAPYGDYVTYILVNLQNLMMVNIGEFTTKIFNKDMKNIQLIDASLSYDGKNIAIYDNESQELAIISTKDIISGELERNINVLNLINVPFSRGYFSWSQDGKWIFFENKDATSINKLNLETMEIQSVLSKTEITNSTGQVSTYIQDWRISQDNNKLIINFGKNNKRISGLWLFILN